MKKILVTGGGGFIGHHLVKKLLEKNEVFVVDNFSRGARTRLENHTNLKILEVDITDFEQLKKNLSKYSFEKIFHLAAINGTDNFYNRPIEVMDVGILGCFNILKFAKLNKIQKLIIASSAEVYQSANIIPTPEEIPLIIPDAKNPRFSYGLSKIYTEFYSYHFALKYGINMCIFRPHNVYGPDMGLKHVIPEFILKFLIGMEANKLIEIEPKGSVDATRAFCYVDDIISGLELISRKNEGVNIYNIGNTNQISIKDLIGKISDILKCNFKLISNKNLHIGGTEKRCPDISKISSIGFNCKTNLDEGLINTIDWYKNNLKMIKSVSNDIY